MGLLGNSKAGELDPDLPSVGKCLVIKLLQLMFKCCARGFDNS
jgi:hypothetical protein